MRAVALALLLAACSGGGEEGAATPQPSPAATGAPVETSSPPDDLIPPPSETGVVCSLLTREEVRSALGAEVTEGTPIATGTCSWSGQGGGLAAGLAVASSTGRDCLATRPPDAPEVEGVGATAWWTYLQAEVGVGTVTACPKGSLVTLTITAPADEATGRAAAEELMALALGRL